ncbi:uncharacterized protein BO95DRAFT_282730 [Aspergillus brunneoviolaceus CBS 621.78]|uniref:Uncharacterized protein n=1 Tax=Aspergillus brunneoviolaceus CBS 621.78 TaxID=1450534 RepID=A0ACD1FVD7_9EURO|nr:hypothetical protein BO95DRAFT_282730 [Aspergillus brunneoviolaceus CBS 621.78]RAH40891.1 hypothetical protein BO95DRAFT_282730 [Aspergillus brunneoviolaceus CBS 621.78]
MPEREGERSEHFSPYLFLPLYSSSCAVLLLNPSQMSKSVAFTTATALHCSTDRSSVATDAQPLGDVQVLRSIVLRRALSRIFCRRVRKNKGLSAEPDIVLENSATSAIRSGCNSRDLRQQQQQLSLEWNNHLYKSQKIIMVTPRAMMIAGIFCSMPTSPGRGELPQLESIRCHFPTSLSKRTTIQLLLTLV